MPDHVESAALSRGDRVGEHTIRALVGQGSTGQVYSAIHPITGDKVAVRIVHPHLTASAAELDQLLTRLRRIVGLKHDNLLTLLECGKTASGALYLTTAYVQGRPLSDLLDKSAPLAPAEAIPLLRQLARGLDAAHARQMIHGALNTDNIWLSPSVTGEPWPPRLRVMDIGPGQLLPLDERLPYYLAPEQCRGEPARAASDRYAVGVIAFQLLTGRLPFSSPRLAEVRTMHLERDPPSPQEHGELPAELEQLVLELLAKQPEQRPPLADVVRRLAAVTPEPASEEPAPEGPAEEPAPGGPAEEPAPGGPAEESGDVPQRPASGDPPGGPVGRRLTLSPLRSAVLAVLAALALMAVAYRVMTGQWPMASTPPPAADGRLTLHTLPAGAAVYLNGTRQAGQTPLTLAPLRQGQTYELYLHLPGHRPWRQRVALGLGETARTLRVALPIRALRFGTLKLGSNVKADFFFDSRRVGTQTREVTLADVRAAVPHLLRVVAPRHQLVEQAVRVPAGKVQVLQFELQPE